MVIDDDMLSAFLHEAGDSFSVPASGPADILDRAFGRGDEPDGPAQTAFDLGDAGVPPRRTVVTAMRAHRVLAIAASVIIVAGLAGIGAVVTTGPSRPASVTAGPLVAHSAPKSTSPLNAGPEAAAGTSSNGAGLDQAGGAGALSTGTASPSTPSATSSAPPLPGGTVGQAARIQQSGSLDLLVAKGALSATMAKLTDLAEFYNGFVANSQTHTGASAINGAPSGSIVLQVPVANFTAVVKAAQSMGKTSQLSTKADDVTAQYVDLQSRITALQASRQQYLTIMAKATTIGDVLAVEAQLDTLQSQIEQLQGQLSVLTSETDYSTFTVTVNEKSTVPHHVTHHSLTGIGRAWHDSVHGFTDGVDGLIGIAGPVLFALLCLGVVLLAGRLLWRRLQRRIL